MTAHRHVQDTRRRRKPCLALSDEICLTRTTDGYLVHYEPPADGTTFRHVGQGGWTLVSGSFEGGDLTIRPSLRISTTRDGQPVELLHGWIRRGRWVPA